MSNSCVFVIKIKERGRKNTRIQMKTFYCSYRSHVGDRFVFPMTKLISGIKVVGRYLKIRNFGEFSELPEKFAKFAIDR